ncbi:hypothetical protein [Romboutsia lituseburensis]|uniref:hypothetical protein n=1 Tax=Romboutsia lituseburensis TaxID=1537 RepID=UPI00215A8C19|nr:hypothetical protein [Romboutsia lituseburensis]MCR8747137.1 hypothetical protein [Romboutsia lituseburensis]
MNLIRSFYKNNTINFNNIVFTIWIIGILLTPIIEYSWIISMIAVIVLKEDEIN